MKKLFKIFPLILLILCVQGCAVNLDLYYEIEDYDDVIGNISEIPSDKENDDMPDIEGFIPLSKHGFEVYAEFGINNYARTSVEGKEMFIDKNGDLLPVPFDATELFNDKYIFKDNGFCGVKNIHGETLIEAEYLSVQIVENIILAKDENKIFVFDNGLLISEVSVSDFDTVELFGSNIIIADGELCDLQFDLIKFAGYKTIGIIDDIAIIKDERERLGYFDIRNNTVIVEPKYWSAGYFVNSYAQVRETYDGIYSIIDTAGNEVAHFENPSFGFYDNYIFVKGKYELELYDSEFKDTGLRFNEVYSNRVYGDFIIDKFYGLVYSLKEKSYITDTYIKIIPFDGGFVCSKDKFSELYDEDMQFIVRADDIHVSSNIISVKHNNRYYYYSKKLK